MLAFEFLRGLEIETDLFRRELHVQLFVERQLIEYGINAFTKIFLLVCGAKERTRPGSLNRVCAADCGARNASRKITRLEIRFQPMTSTYTK